MMLRPVVRMQDPHSAQGPSQPRAIIVENDAVMRTLLGVLARRTGYVVDAVTSVAAAREQLHKFGYHLVLLNSNLPDGHGAEVACLVRASRLSPAAPIIAISSDHSYGIAGRLRRAGAIRFLRMPFSTPELLRILEKHYPGRSSDAFA